jgi:hypothetical protein
MVLQKNLIKLNDHLIPAADSSTATLLQLFLNQLLICCLLFKAIIFQFHEADSPEMMGYK